ncbi:MAG: hypothetical protein AB7I38_11685 [Dehalococcoidia bacterium]
MTRTGPAAAAIASIRAAALADAVRHAEHERAKLSDVYGADVAPTHEAAIVAVLDEAIAWWAVETRQGRQVRTADDAHRYADRLGAMLAEHAESIVGALLPTYTQAAARREIVLDMVGETD